MRRQPLTDRKGRFPQQSRTERRASARKKLPNGRSCIQKRVCASQRTAPRSSPIGRLRTTRGGGGRSGCDRTEAGTGTWKPDRKAAATSDVPTHHQEGDPLLRLRGNEYPAPPSRRIARAYRGPSREKRGGSFRGDGHGACVGGRERMPPEEGFRLEALEWPKGCGGVRTARAPGIRRRTPRPPRPLEKRDGSGGSAGEPRFHVAGAVDDRLPVQSSSPAASTAVLRRIIATPTAAGDRRQRTRAGAAAGKDPLPVPRLGSAGKAEGTGRAPRERGLVREMDGVPGAEGGARDDKRGRGPPPGPGSPPCCSRRGLVRGLQASGMGPSAPKRRVSRSIDRSRRRGRGGSFDVDLPPFSRRADTCCGLLVRSVLVLQRYKYQKMVDIWRNVQGLDILMPVALHPGCCPSARDDRALARSPPPRAFAR